MRLLEHEAKTLLSKYSIPVPGGVIINKHTSDTSIRLPAVLKSQVPVGGRGKLGGVVVVESSGSLKEAIDTLFSLDINGHKPDTLLAEEKLSIVHEHYLCLLVDRSTSDILLIAHKEGGVEVESREQSDFFTRSINESTIDANAKQLARYLGYSPTDIRALLTKLLTVFVRSDATLLEINPLVHISTGGLVCGDCKMELDDAAGFRHLDWNFEDASKDTNFVTLNPRGTVATIANGAGLAMATVDAVADIGLSPANFLDIGGGASEASTLEAFQKIVKYPNIQAIVINIFAGITRCDEVAKAIIAAKARIENLPPLYIRLAGTNFEQAAELLVQEGIPLQPTLEACLTAVKREIAI